MISPCIPTEEARAEFLKKLFPAPIELYESAPSAPHCFLFVHIRLGRWDGFH
jgi:hypothetical protein